MKTFFFTILLTLMCFTYYGQTWDLEDYSEYKSAASHEGINYPADWSKAHLYPDFSWDVIPQHLTFKSGTILPDETYEKAAEYSLVDVNGADFGYDTWDEGMWQANRILKSYNPNVCGSFYLNLKIHFPWYLHSPEFESHPEWATGELLRDYELYNHDDADFRQFWADVMLDGLDDPNVDFGFIDKTIKLPSPFYNAAGIPNESFAKSLDLLYNSLPEDKFLIGNTLRNESDGGNRSAMQVYDGSYLERWHQKHKDYDQTDPEALAVTIQLAREALSKGKLIIFRNTVDDYNNNTRVLTNKDFYVPLAAFLMMAEENATISFQGSNRVGTDGSIWDTRDLEFFSNYLGAPLGPPVKNGLVYTRSFDNLDVYLDLSAETMETCTAIFTWKGKTGPGDVSEVTGVSVSPTTFSLTTGGTRQLSATVSPSDATNKNITWSTSNNEVATVSTSGLVTAKGNGTASITVRTSDGGYTANSSITVSDGSGCATFTRIEAEDYDDMFGISVGAGVDTDGTDCIKDPNVGDWVMYSDIDLTCATSVSARVASYRDGGSIEVRIDAVDGTLIGTISQGTTGGWTSWVTAGTNITDVNGVHDVYLVFSEGSGRTLYLNWFELSGSVLNTQITEKKSNVYLYPNPATNELKIKLNNFETANISILNNVGQTVIYKQFNNRINTVDTSTLPAGMYIVKITNKTQTLTRKFIKK
jgi:hypothetical protein